jgi:hypothetical protein
MEVSSSSLGCIGLEIVFRVNRDPPGLRGGRLVVCNQAVIVQIAPPIEQTLRFRHFSCPECQGALERLRDETTGMMTYLCRIGHRYAGRELLIGKELRIEQMLWASLTQLDELIAVLTELEEESDGAKLPSDRRERYEHALRQRAQLEIVIAENAPVQFESDPPIECDPNSRLRQG